MSEQANGQPPKAGQAASLLAWLVMYTKPRWEKKLADQLTQKGFTVYCPTQRVKRRWSDRTKNFGLFKDYPSIKQGATIHIALIPEKIKDEKDKRERKPFDMNQAVATVSASLASFATLYILLTR